MPSAAAFPFISAAKSSALPARWQAMARAASLAETSISPYSRSRIGSDSPRTRPMRELLPPSRAASSGTATAALRAPAISIARMQVMILVVLAGMMGASGFFA